MVLVVPIPSQRQGLRRGWCYRYLQRIGPTNKRKLQGESSSSVQERTGSWCVPPGPDVFKLRLGGHHQGEEGVERFPVLLACSSSQCSRVLRRVGSRCVTIFQTEIFKDWDSACPLAQASCLIYSFGKFIFCLLPNSFWLPCWLSW